MHLAPNRYCLQSASETMTAMSSLSVDLIVPLSFRERPGSIGHRVPFFIDVLAENGSICKVRGVTLHPEGGIVYGDSEDRILSQCHLQFVKGSLLLSLQDPGCGTSQLGQRTSDLMKSLMNRL